VPGVEAHAAEAEQRVVEALAHADDVRAEAEAHSKDNLASARSTADRLVSDAREMSDQILSDAMSMAERERITAHRQVEELNRQRESITAYLDELRGLLGANRLADAQRLAEVGTTAKELSAAAEPSA
jgi:cell division septum initiation protein DivIVA